MSGSARRVAGLLARLGWQAARPQFIWTLLTMLAAAAASVTYPLGLREMTDGLEHHDHRAMVLGVALTAVLFTLSWGLQIIGAVQASGLTDRCNLAVTARLAWLVNAAPGLEHFERPDHLQELDLLDQNRRALASGPRQAVSLLQVLVRVLGIAILLALVYPPLCLLPLAGLGPFLGDRRAARQRDAGEQETVEPRRLARELFSLTSTAGPAKELRAYGLSDDFLGQYEALTDHARRTTNRRALVGGVWSGLGWLLYAGAFAAAIAVIAIRAARGDTSIGQVVLAVSLLRRAQMSVSQAADSIGQLLTTAQTAKRLLWLEDYVTESSRPPLHPGPVPGRLRLGIGLEGVGFSYPGTEAKVLEDLDIWLPAGSSVAIVGENGSGKTTLAKLLSGMYRPTEGRILVDGTDLLDLPIDAWRARTTAAFQDFVTYDLTAAENVGVGDLDRLSERRAVEAALDRARSSDVLTFLPDGLDTLIGRSFSGGLNLSGGQSQKLALGRAMMRDDPLLLIFDEPTASLDAPTESALFDNYVATARRSAAIGAVTILVSHRFSTVRSVDLILVMDRGRLAEAGSHDELVRAGGLYAELFELQARAYR